MSSLLRLERQQERFLKIHFELDLYLFSDQNGAKTVPFGGGGYKPLWLIQGSTPRVHLWLRLQRHESSEVKDVGQGKRIFLAIIHGFTLFRI